MRQAAPSRAVCPPYTLDTFRVGWEDYFGRKSLCLWLVACEEASDNDGAKVAYRLLREQLLKAREV